MNNHPFLSVRYLSLFFIFLFTISANSFAAKNITNNALFLDSHKVFVNKSNPLFKEIVDAIKPIKKIDYSDKILFIVSTRYLQLIPEQIKKNIHIDDKQNSLRIRGQQIDTTKKIPSVDESYRQKPSADKKMSIIQFSGPVKTDWYNILKQQDGIEIVSYIRHNAYIIFSDPTALKAALNNEKISPYIQWSGPFHPAYKLDSKFKRKDILKKLYNNNRNLGIEVIVQLYKNKNTLKTIKIIESLIGKPVSKWTLGNIVNLHIKTNRKYIETLVNLPDALFVELYIPPSTGAERLGLIVSNQYSSGTHPTTNSADYLSWITQKLEPTIGAGVGEFNFIVDITDHPVDDGTTTLGSVHKVFNTASSSATRILYQQSHNSLAPAQDKAGHGTFVASVAAGYPIDGDLANNNSNGYRHGLGIAPYAKIGSTQYFAMLDNRDSCFGSNACNSFCSGDASCTTACLAKPFECGLGTPASLRDRMRVAYNNSVGGTIGTRISNNSWGTGLADSSYGSISQLFDAMTRDVDDISANEQAMLFVFLSGNSGAGGLWGYGSTAKNTITVGGSATNNPRSPDVADGCGYQNAAATGLDNMYPASGVGPVDTGIIKPDLVAPAMRINAAVTEDPEYPAKGKGICEAGDPPTVAATNPDGEYPLGHVLYTQSSGTSFAAPAVSGAAANLRHWLTELKSVADPKPSLLKAWLINTAKYMSATGGNLPSSNQGMGRLDMQRSLDSASRIIRNETVDLAVSDNYSISGKVTDPAQAINVTLVWTDAVPSTIDGGLVNDLNLSLSLNGTDFYCGNNYTAADSNNYANLAACSFDSENNVESISIPASSLNTGDSITINVNAATVPPGALLTGGSNINQDFSLVAYNVDLTSTNTGMSVDEASGSNTIATSMLSSQVPDDLNASDIIYTLLSVPAVTSGTLRNNVTVLAASDTFTQQDLLNNTINFTPASTDGTDALFTFSVSDSTGVINAPTQTFNIAINTAPTANNKSQTAAESPVIENVPSDTANGNMLSDVSPDSDADGTTPLLMSVTRTIAPVPATACSSFPCAITGQFGVLNILDNSGNYTYTLDDSDPDTDSLAEMQAVTDEFSYTITDGSLTATATLAISISGRNDAPAANNDGSLAVPLTVEESVAESPGGFLIAVLANDTDIDDTLNATTVNITSGPAFGTTLENIDGTITYNANPDYVGADQFTYTVNDSNGDISNTASVFINVTPSNDSPSINAPSGTLFQQQNTSMDFAPANLISVADIDVDGVTGIFDVVISTPGAGNGIFNATGTAVVTGNDSNNINFSGSLNSINAALATLRYIGNTGTTGTETITISINDNGNTGAADEPNMVSTTFDITLTANAPPVLELDSDNDNRPPANNTDFENTFDLGSGEPIEIAEGTTIVDADTASPVSVTVTLTNPFNGSDETLSIAGSTSGVSGNIAFSYSAAVLSLTANAGATPSYAEYAAVIDLIRYDNNASTPDTVNRIITITVNDGISSDSATSTIDFQRRPVDIALVLDTSGSMQQLVDGTPRIELLKDAVQLFLETWDGFDISNDRLATVYFNTAITSFPAPLTLQSFDSNWAAHNSNIALQTAAGWTSFGAGLQTAIEGLSAAPSGGLNRKPVVITFTDGQQNGSPMVMRPGTNYAPGDPAPVLDAAMPYQILDATIGDMVDDGFTVNTLSGVTQAGTPISLSSADMPMNIHTIGTGVSGSNLETMLSKLSADTGGENFFATPDSFLSAGAGIPSPLQDHFMTTLVSSLSETSLEMVGRVFSQLDSSTKTTSHRFTLNNATQRASFILSWNKNISMDELAFTLKTPQGNFIPVGTRGVDIRSSDYYFIVHLEFPLVSVFSPIAAGGEWEMIIQRKSSPLAVLSNNLAAVIPVKMNPVDYSVWVLEDESDVKDRINSDKRHYKVGEPILLSAKVTDVARTVKNLSVIARVNAPKTGLGSYLAENYIRDKDILSTRSSAAVALDAPQTLYDKNLALLLNLSAFPNVLAPATNHIRLHDDGKAGDKVANDGIFSALYEDTDIPGAYTFNISIRGKLPVNGNILRQSSITVVTEFDSFDRNKSTIKYSNIDPQTDIKTANKQIFITPVDKFGNLLGPGKSQLFRINISGGKLVGRLNDLGNGSYVQYLSVNELLINPVISIDAPGAAMIPVDSNDQLTLKEWLLILFIILIFVLFLYWLFKRLR